MREDKGQAYDSYIPLTFKIAIPNSIN